MLRVSFVELRPIKTFAELPSGSLYRLLQTGGDLDRYPPLFIKLKTRQAYRTMVSNCLMISSKTGKIITSQCQEIEHCLPVTAHIETTPQAKPSCPFSELVGQAIFRQGSGETWHKIFIKTDFDFVHADINCNCLCFSRDMTLETCVVLPETPCWVQDAEIIQKGGR